MKISKDNALAFYKYLDNAQLRLSYLPGGGGQIYIDYLKALRATFTPADVDPGLFESIGKIVDDIATHLTVPVMNPVVHGEPIPVPRRELLPDAAAAIGYINDAVNWLRDHQE